MDDQDVDEQPPGEAPPAEDDPNDMQAKMRRELAELKIKSASGAKMSGKEKKNLKKLLEAEKRWAEYDEACKPEEDGDAAAIGSQFSASSGSGRGGGPQAAVENLQRLHVDSFSIHANALELFTDATLTLEMGHRYGLVGPNGRGKTTLLKHIAQRALRGIPKDLDAVYVEQEVKAGAASAVETVLAADKRRTALLEEEQQLEAALDESGGEAEGDLERAQRLLEVYDEQQAISSDSAESRVRAILTGLGFTMEMQDQPTSSFSGGWRMRVSLARALYLSPTVLLLDEPTNHLDLNAVMWLGNYLARLKNNMVVVVSHDRHFLNQISTDIILLESKKLHYFTGDYDDFDRKHAAFTQGELKKHDKEKKKLDKMKSSLQGGGGGSKANKNARAEVKKLEEDLKEAAPDKEYKVKFIIAAAERRLNSPLVTMEKVMFKYKPAEAPIFENLNFELSMDSRVAIVGPNGAGKTTFINLLNGSLAANSGDVDFCNGRLRIGGYSQHFVDELPGAPSAVEYLFQKCLGKPADKSTREYQQVRAELGMKGLMSTGHTIPIRDLSGGQKARVKFAEVALMAPHVLLLDEPTNHLDMESVDALIEAINTFEGGVVIISHDRRLLSQTNCELLVCADKGVHNYKGGFTEYEKDVLKEIADQEAKIQQAAKRKLQQREKQRKERAEKAAATINKKKPQ